jgi:membrane protein DedA with SNARE-associated domain/rhodanese-related sulfurtransferase
MNELMQFVAENGYLIIFVGIFAEQVGVPIPSNFLLIVAGALAGRGELELSLIILLGLVAALLGDTIWFYIGRLRGFQVLGFLCRISLEPDSCVSGAKGMFTLHGERSLLIAKFVPGFSTVAQPLAGATGMRLSRFFIFDGLGSALWVVVFVGSGYIFSDQFEHVIEYAAGFGWWFGAVLITALAFYIGWKFLIRRRFLRSLRAARINSADLKEMLEADEDVFIVDLRDPLDFAVNPQVIPTALRLPPADFEERSHELPRDRDIVLYCTCPNEATSARVAMRLHRRGLKRVRPLHGGFQGWIDSKYPTDNHIDPD